MPKVLQVSELSAEYQQLCEAAVQALSRSHSPYSRFPVSCALLCFDASTGVKRVQVGVNVENAAYPLCTCAERTAVCAAVANGYSQFEAIAVTTKHLPTFCTPCGACRQTLAEFAVYPAASSENPSASTLLNRDGNAGTPQPSRSLADFVVLCFLADMSRVQVWTLAELLPGSFGSNDLASSDAMQQQHQQQ
eukprot:ANDGO_00807.mRNA.1 Cytidine deaminase